MLGLAVRLLKVLRVPYVHLKAKVCHRVLHLGFRPLNLRGGTSRDTSRPAVDPVVIDLPSYSTANSQHSVKVSHL